MKIKILFFLLIIAKLSYGQEVQSIQKRESITDNYTLNYTTSLNKVLNGAYNITDLDKKLVLNGNYSNGNKNGLWLLFDKENAIRLSYSFSSNKLIFISPDFFSNVTFVYTQEKSKDFRLALPLFSFDILFDLLSQNKEFTSLDKDKAKNLSLTVSVDDMGKAIYSINNQEDILINKLDLENSKNFNLEWIPAINNSKNTAIKYIFPLSIAPIMDAEKQRFRWNY